MDPIGATASLLTLIDTAFGTFKLIKSLVDGYQNAPTEIRDLQHRLHLLSSNLRLLRHVQLAVSRDQNVLDLDSADFDILKLSLAATQEIFEEIHAYLFSRTTREGPVARLRWALRDASKVKAWERRLRWHGNLLQNTMGLLTNMYASFFEAKFEALTDEIRLQNHHVNKQLSKKTSRFSWSEEVLHSDWVLPHVASLSGSVCCTKDVASEHKLYSVSVRLHALFWLKVFSMELRVKQASLFSVQFSAIGTGVVLKNVVPEDSLIVVACQAGDTSTVWDLLNERKASVNDVTPNNFSPLSFAIANGAVDLLDLLASRHADPRESFGRLQTSPLAWAMAHRQLSVAHWLVARGTDVHHINVIGWTPVFCLFGTEPCHQEPCEEYLDLLTAESFNDFNAQDGGGLTAMHRAAAFGTPDHIRSLISRGASTSIRENTMGWTPIFCAVLSGNVPTFKELARHQSNFTATDFRRWTLLHLAVNVEQLDIMKHLIDSGADPLATSTPTHSIEEIDLRGLALTPGDIASIRGAATLSAYSEAWAKKDSDFLIRYDEEDDRHDLFWLASERLVQVES